jgi:type II secretion system protein J
VTPTARHPAGFTLLEILISIAITTMLVTAGFTAFRGITQVMERSRPEMNRGPVARVLLDRLESELLATTLVVKQPFRPRLRHPWLFVGEDRVFGTNDSDAVKFVTSNPARPPGAQSESGLRMVTYAVGGSDAEEGLSLYRSEVVLPRGMLKRINLNRSVSILHDLVALRFRYLDEKGWRERWDSTALGQLDELPLAVEISLQLYDEQPDGTRAPGAVYTRTVPLPVRPVKPSGGVVDASCPGGVTLRGCMLRLRVAIDRLGGLKDAVVALRLATPDRCWAPANESPQLANLKETLRSSLSVDPDEVCG